MAGPQATTIPLALKRPCASVGAEPSACRRKREDLGNIKMTSEERLQLHEKERKKLNKNLVQIQEGAREAEEYCESIITQLISCLQGHYGTVQELIEAQEGAAVDKVQSSLQKLEGKIEEELEDLLLPFEGVKRAVQEFGSRLEVFCDKEILAISQNVREGISKTDAQCQPTFDPKTRAEFLAFACELTFDPNTAHKDLILSKNDKEVNVSQSQDKCRDQSEPHPERFTHRRQLLCTQGLDAAAERCYYEVEVCGDKAEIALAYRGLDRKSRTISSAFGGTSKSWSLDRSNVYSVSHNGDGIQLLTSPSHRRVGVYLNFKEGTLTFYEVSENMTFLYRVEATFTEPLYPGFWLGDKCCIRLCDLRQVNVPTG